MILKYKVLAFALVIVCSSGLHFKSKIEPQKQRCFYEVLSNNKS